ncbi:MAG: PaaI family thioesterase [Gammaproteobacteria bacterium]|jgi:uncharacterized protein (TIGR00369 family)
MDTEQRIRDLNDTAPPCVQSLGGRVEAFDAERHRIEMRFSMPLEFCHSGNVVQGGFVTGMLDAAMAHAVFCEVGERIPLPSLEISVSFLRPTLAGPQLARARILRLGRSIAFLEGELFDQDGRLTARATSTARAVRDPAP